MGVVIQIDGYKDHKAAELANYDALECPVCETACPPTKVDAEGAVHHKCAGNGHRSITWRISVDGVMLRGAKGNRQYSI